MKLTIENVIEYSIYFIIIIKVFFYSSIVGTVVFKHYKPESEFSKTLFIFFSYWREKTEFIYFIIMGFLLIIIFIPYYNHKKYINKEMGILFWLFGFVIIFTSKWNVFFYDIIKWYNLKQNKKGLIV